ncbi:MAG: phosphoenolpyruvate-utilizing N-terminal domain-containing protein, partial [Bacteroidales bacterium]|nr:phosphoenolpyruvate-utilizing N-terminal domain-containing protein [Bacteroidales bacterium]
MRILKTLVPSEALAIGPAFVIERSGGGKAEVACREPGPSRAGIDEGADGLSEAFATVARQLAELSESHDVFAAHLEILEDPLLRETIDEFVGEGCDVPTAVRRTSATLAAQFADIDDEYLRARADDVRDVCRRLLDCLQGTTDNAFEHLLKGCVVVADELFPSDTAMIDMSMPIGFLTAKGSRTSHVCIIARQHGIATMTGVEGAHRLIRTGDMLILDGKGGQVVVNPDGPTLDEYTKRVGRQLPSPSVAGQLAA